MNINNWFKQIARILTVFTGLILLAICALYWYVTHAWTKYYTQTEVAQYAAKINAAPSMQPLFYALYDKLNSNCRHKTMQEVYLPGITGEILGIGKNNCICWVNNAAIPFLINNKKWHRFGSQILGLGLQEYTTPEKCFDFCIQHEAYCLTRDFPMYGIDTSRPFYQLNDTTSILTYMVIADRPTYYRCRLDELAERVKSLRDQLK